MKRTGTSLILVILSLFGLQTYGQNVKVDGEIRTRGELRSGFREPLADSLNTSYVNNLRTKLNVFYEGKDFKAKISFIDSRTSGATDVAKTGNGLGVLEAWGEYNFTPELSFSVGRQGLEYDDKRLFSYNNWSNTPGAHDIVLLKYKKGDFTIHAGSAYNNVGDSIQYLAPYTQSYKTLNYIWLTKDLGKVSASALWVNDSFEKGSVNNVTTTYRNTVGGNVWLTDKKNPFTFLASGYYQFGRDKSNRSLSAYALALTLQQKINEKYSLVGGAETYSGSKDDIEPNKNNTFNKLYGTNHAFNGSIEYWSTLPTQGLVDLYIGATAKPSSKFDINLTYHNFSSAQTIEANGKKAIGSEIDITANYIVSKQFAIQGGWSTYFSTNGTDILKNKVGVDTKFAQWAYIQLTFKPTFFTKSL